MIFFCYHLRIALFNLHNAAWSSNLEPYTPHLLICFPLLSWRKCTCNVNVPLAMSAQLLFFFSKRLLNLTYIFLCHTLAHWRCCTHMISLFWLLIFFQRKYLPAAGFVKWSDRPVYVGETLYVCAAASDIKYSETFHKGYKNSLCFHFFKHWPETFISIDYFYENLSEYASFCCLSVWWTNSVNPLAKNKCNLPA